MQHLVDKLLRCQKETMAWPEMTREGFEELIILRGEKAVDKVCFLMRQSAKNTPVAIVNFITKDAVNAK